MFKKRYGNVFQGPKEWQKIETTTGQTYKWNPGSTYVQNPPYFVGMPKQPGKLNDIVKARELAILGDSITTDHISPAGSIKRDGVGRIPARAPGAAERVQLVRLTPRQS